MKRAIIALVVMLMISGCGRVQVESEIDCGKLVSVDVRPGGVLSPDVTIITTDQRIFTIYGSFRLPGVIIGDTVKVVVGKRNRFEGTRRWLQFGDNPWLYQF